MAARRATDQDLREATEFFSQDHYAVDGARCEILDVAPQYARCRIKLGDIHRNAMGWVMGGVQYTLADFTFAVATNFRQVPTVTTVSQISYLGQVKGDELIAEAELLKDGHHTCFYRINIEDNLGNQIATVTTTGNHVGHKKA